MFIVFIKHLLHQKQDFFVIVVVDVPGWLVFKLIIVERDQEFVDHVAAHLLHATMETINTMQEASNSRSVSIHPTAILISILFF